MDITFKNSNFITYILLRYYFSDFVSTPLKMRAVESLAYLLTYITFFRCLTQKNDIPSSAALLLVPLHTHDDDSQTHSRT